MPIFREGEQARNFEEWMDSLGPGVQLKQVLAIYMHLETRKRDVIQVDKANDEPEEDEPDHKRPRRIARDHPVVAGMLVDDEEEEEEEEDEEEDEDEEDALELEEPKLNEDGSMFFWKRNEIIRVFDFVHVKYRESEEDREFQAKDGVCQVIKIYTAEGQTANQVVFDLLWCWNKTDLQDIADVPYEYISGLGIEDGDYVVSNSIQQGLAACQISSCIGVLSEFRAKYKGKYHYDDSANKTECLSVVYGLPPNFTSFQTQTKEDFEEFLAVYSDRSKWASNKFYKQHLLTLVGTCEQIGDASNPMRKKMQESYYEDCEFNELVGVIGAKCCLCNKTRPCKFRRRKDEEPAGACCVKRAGTLQKLFAFIKAAKEAEDDAEVSMKLVTILAFVENSLRDLS